MLAEEGGSSPDGIQLSSFGGSNNNKNSTSATSTNIAPPSWVYDVEKVEQLLSDIMTLQNELLHMHAQRIGSVFGKDLDNMEHNIESMTVQVTDKFRLAEQYLQKVGLATRRSGGQEATVGANVQRSLAKRLQEQSVLFRQSQRKYLAEVKAQKSGGLASVPGGSNRFGIDLNETTTSSTTSSPFFNPNQQQQQLSFVVDDLTEAVQSRDSEIIKIAQSIEELSSIFKELAVLVIDQGTILDRIDYNMETVVESTKTGIKQLEKAEKHQKNARPMRCIICLSITVFILLFILILKHRPRRHW